MPRLTDAQLVILSAASQRNDRGVELPANIKGEAARRIVDKLVRASLLEEVAAGGSLPLWRRDDDSGAMALRITKQGLAAIDVEDVAAAPVVPENSIRRDSHDEAESAHHLPRCLPFDHAYYRDKHMPLITRRRANSSAEGLPCSARR